MRRRVSNRSAELLIAAAAFSALTGANVFAQTTTTNGSALAVRSSGTGIGNGVRLQQNGFVGTYVTLAAPGAVTLSVNATGQLGGGVAPRMNVVVDDSSYGFDVGAAASSYSTPSISLPAGTHFIRTEFTNDVSTVDRRLTVNSLQVNGATLANSNTDANALAASDTYIANFRKGDATVALQGAAPGTSVQVNLVNHAFKFGTEVPGFSTASSVNALLGNNPAPGSNAAKYQQHLLENFNSITPGNAGKWDSNEANKDVVTMAGVDRILQYAADHGLRARQHNLIWGSQQPAYINTLLTNAAAGDATAKASLTTEVQQRIQYYVHDRATRYAQLDVYNESSHTPQYFNVYGASGVADFYNQAAAAAQQAGANVGLFTNEYNVLADGADSFANWYRAHVESIRQAGGEVDGIGVQYYSHEGVGTGNSLHSASRVFGALNNLSVAGLPLELTEFGIKDDGSGTAAQNLQTDAQVLRESMRLVFGTPQSTGFTIWGFWGGEVWDQAPNGVLYDANWNLTPAGEAYRDLMTLDADADLTDDWTTQLTAIVGPDGTINFNGFYGYYDLIIGGKTYSLDLVKGTTNYSIAVPEPTSSISGAIITLAALTRRQRRSA